jgi:flagella basal body P-ring formation protein FlgA
VASQFLESEAKALEEGAKGDVISIEYVATKKRARGRVESAQRVIVED